MLGRGLESLIPQKQNTNSVPTTHTSPSVSQENHAMHEHQESFHTNVVKEYPRRDVHKHSHNGTSSDDNHAHHGPRRDEAIYQIEVEQIKSNPYQPRREFNEESLKELAQSIREFGVLQPIVVTKIVRESEHGAAVEYQLIAGERRLMASKLIGLERIPAIIKTIDSQRVKLELALIENIQRSQLSAIDLAKAYARLQDEFNLTQREIALRVGKSREVIANTLRLLNLSQEAQEALASHKINESQARALLTITNPLDQQKALAQILQGKMSVRTIREDISQASKQEGGLHEERYWERQLEEKLGSSVKIMRNGVQGKLTVQFYSEEEWRALLEKLLGQERV